MRQRYDVIATLEIWNVLWIYQSAIAVVHLYLRIEECVVMTV